MADYTTVFASGKIYWPKIIGDKALHDNYDGDAREWSYEFVPDDPSFLKEHRLLDRLKDTEDAKNPGKGEFLKLKKPELNKDGEKNDPISVINNDESVVDGDGNMVEGWDGRLLGNATEVIAKLTIVNYGGGKKKSIWTNALRIDKHVPYEGAGSGGDSFAAYDGGSKKSSAKKTATKAAKADSKGKAQELDDLDDDVPF